MGERNLWIAVAAIGTFLGGVAAVIAVMGDSDISFGRRAPTYSEAISCAAASSPVSLAVRCLEGRGELPPADIDERIRAVRSAGNAAEGEAARLASSEGKGASDVQQELYTLTAGVAMVEANTICDSSDRLRRDLSSAEQRCEAFLR